MSNFSWNKALGYGATIWSAMFVFGAILYGFNLFDSFLSKILFVSFAGILSYILTISTEPLSDGEAFGYGLSWILVGFVLDLIITVQFNTAIFSTWEYWFAYLFVLFAPFLEAGTFGEIRTSPVTRRHAHSH